MKLGNETIRDVLITLHIAVFLIVFIFFILFMSMATFLIIAPGLAALVVIILSLKRGNRRVVLVISSVITLLAFALLISFLGAVFLAMSHARSFSPWIAAAFLPFLALEICTIIFSGKSKEGS